MLTIDDVDAVVFDILGTLVDHDGGLRAAITGLTGGAGDPDDLLARWHRHVAGEHARVVSGERPYATADVLDREAAEAVVAHAGGPAPTEDALVAAAHVMRGLHAWPDTVALLDALAARVAVIGLSNADRTTLLRMNAHAGLRWHAALSTETVASYKPDPAVYRLAIAHAGRPPERVLMVAAHAWDLRGAAAAGLRTAYLDRPGADPPAPGDRFDHRAGSAAELLALLGVTPERDQAGTRAV
ncbi:haloacid dehalogenase type II [Actinomycetospora straminea]|uniref:Haloacid dehalogenase type II n=1 Tax=Actinomycetospora straminea TaxID=663607 RepID=A0ABP9DRB1_9PSEU|nr:haloacid dehalogenase type II [Actinomycetospora straminea]MDD7936254.1 haloacid dehalogenase type II [Actinomycetospora straminea]